MTETPYVCENIPLHFLKHDERPRSKSIWFIPVSPDAPADGLTGSLYSDSVATRSNASESMWWLMKAMRALGMVGDSGLAVDVSPPPRACSAHTMTPERKQATDGCRTNVVMDSVAPGHLAGWEAPRVQASVSEFRASGV